MRRILLFGMATLLMISCSVGDDDAFDSDIDAIGDKATNTTGVFEGVWNIDGMTLQSTYVVSLTQQQNQTIAVFNTFPYHAVTEQLVEGLVDFDVTEPDAMPSFPLTTVGYSSSSSFDEIAPSSDSKDQELSFVVNQANGQRLTVTLELLPSRSTFVIRADALNCILAVKRLTTTDSDGQKYRMVFNPERLLTFTSIMRIK